MQRPAVFFDFDGTLVDPCDGLLDSFVHGLAAVGVVVEDKHSLEPLIGPPIRYGFSTYLGLAEPSLSVAVEAFRHYLGTKGVLEYAPYEGMIELLDDLWAKGTTLAMVTSKSLPFVELIVDHLDLRTEFARKVTSSLDGSIAEEGAAGRNRVAPTSGRAGRPGPCWGTVSSTSPGPRRRRFVIVCGGLRSGGGPGAGLTDRKTVSL